MRPKKDLTPGGLSLFLLSIAQILAVLPPGVRDPLTAVLDEHIAQAMSNRAASPDDKATIQELAALLKRQLAYALKNARRSQN